MRLDASFIANEATIQFHMNCQYLGFLLLETCIYMKKMGGFLPFNNFFPWISVMKCSLELNFVKLDDSC